MPTFRKRPVEVKAALISELILCAKKHWSELPDWVASAYEAGKIIFLPSSIHVFTSEGRMLGEQDDWLIQGVKGELYPCKPDVFAATYDEVKP